MKNRRPDLNGLLVLDKPLGWTSADCCRYFRKGTRGAKVGHAGTLDPLATGVLILCFGRATRRIDALMAQEKRYRAQVDLAHVSPTDDLEAPPAPVEVATPPERSAVESACARFVGRIMQVPPAHSAVWVDGTRSYHLARRGEAVGLPPRPVEVREVAVLTYDWPILTIDVRCGKGTYIRALARDIGAALGTGGMLASLRRTASGGYTDATAIDPRTITQGLEAGDLLEAEPDAPARR
jgi:tRNA pseudouridine55 synthase